MLVSLSRVKREWGRVKRGIIINRELTRAQQPLIEPEMPSREAVRRLHAPEPFEQLP